MFETRDYNLWTKLQLPFRFVAPASELVVTTHDAKVARTMGAPQIHKILSEDDCWEIFVQHALNVGNRILPKVFSIRNRPEDYINCERLTISALKSLIN